MNDKMKFFALGLQLVWLVIGTILQIWIGGTEGTVVAITGHILFLINTLAIVYLSRQN